jgi:phage terminase large subunit-like protein
VPTTPAEHPVSRYARSVLSGETVAGEFVRLAAARHLRDLEDGPERGLRFDLRAADVALDFFRLLKHSTGKWAGTAFELQPWQVFVIGSLFGWKRLDGSRRFTIGHVEVARKNGKSTLAGGVGLLLFLLDSEAGAEVYTVATKKDQAKLTHDEAKRMVQASPHLAKRVAIYKDNLSVAATHSKFEPLASDSDSLDGLNVSGAIMDELHAWKQRGLWDVMETATGARRQPLFLVTTTAGYNRHSIWWERREMALNTLRGLTPNDSLFAFVATLDPEDDWTDEKVWAKANPSLGVTVRLEELREKCDEAKQVPGKQNAFKRLRLNLPTEQASLWLDLEKWDACAGPVDEESLLGRPCFGGLDLSATTDLSALALLFPPEADDEPWKLLVRFWLPGDDLRERSIRDGVPYGEWSDRGLIHLTDGSSIDYDAIEAQVLLDAERFAMQELAFDRYLANQLVTRLQDRHGVNVVGFGQGFVSMAGPAKEFEVLVISGRLAHGGNPVLRWQAGCTAVKQDAAGNVKPDKASSTARIDGIVASLMALGRAMVRTEGTEEWYTPGILSS